MKRVQTGDSELQPSFFRFKMKLTLTKSMQQSVELAMKQPEFSVKYKEEAEMITKVKSIDTKSFPITVELLQYVSKCLGKI